MSRNPAKKTNSKKGPTKANSPAQPSTASTSSPAPPASFSVPTPNDSGFSPPELELMRTVHALATAAGDNQHLPAKAREDTHYIEVLQPRFSSAHQRQKFILVIESLVTVCTATPGEDNVSLMISLGDPVHNRNIHIFVCQNGGRPFAEVKKVLETTWVILRKMHALLIKTLSTLAWLANKKPFSSEAWEMFQQVSFLLFDHSKSELFPAGLKALEVLVPKGLNLVKTIQKAIKVEAAIDTLAKPGLSSFPRTLTVPLADFEGLRPSSIPSVTIQAKTHSECEIVAVMITDPTYRQLQGNIIPINIYGIKLGFSGSHGGVESGWTPPTLLSACAQVLGEMEEELKRKLGLASDQEKESVSSTSSSDHESPL
ncbi:hypothetical protein B0H14DRAFT_3858642 [Mycena olivaceomarginata]|nr:hypothetical protein B0H14DRAFT_3858642 [Mycena olivaceomarginata]